MALLYAVSLETRDLLRAANRAEMWIIPEGLKVRTWYTRHFSYCSHLTLVVEINLQVLESLSAVVFDHFIPRKLRQPRLCM